jgi:hypothetical protein
MRLRALTYGLLCLATIACSGTVASCEEIILKDGQKIVGTIVGYENEMFRVETTYGVALVRKDKIALIQVSKPDDAKTGPAAPKNPPVITTEAKPATVRGGSPVTSPAPQPAPAAHPAPVAHADPAGPAPTPPPVPPPPPASHPVDMPMPAHLEEHVDGNTYFSDTFKFSLFKPPDWKIYEGVPKETGSGIMAMGTEDEQTLLFVDRQVWSGVPKLTSDQVDAKLRETYQEYRRISEEPFECDGQTVMRRDFTGTVDGVEWHGVALHLIRGNTVFGIIGLTSSENFQFQQAVLNKILKTFHFFGPGSPL